MQYVRKILYRIRFKFFKLIFNPMLHILLVELKSVLKESLYYVPFL